MDVKVLTREDIIEIIKYLIGLINAKSDVDDIDHLSNRRVRTVGEQLYNQFGVGLARISRPSVREMNVRAQRSVQAYRPYQRQDDLGGDQHFSAPTHCRSLWTRPILWPKSPTSAVFRPWVPAVCRVSVRVSRCATCTTPTTDVSARSRPRRDRTSV